MKWSRERAIQKCAELAGVKLLAIEQHRKHAHVILENGRRVVTAITPSDWRGDRNLVRDLKKQGAL